VPTWETLLIFTAAAVVMNLSPGPSNFYVLSRSINQGVSAGLIAALGLAAGSLVHVAAGALGLAVIFQTVPVIYSALKIIGAAYLIYLGIRMFIDAPARVSVSAERGRHRPLSRIFRESVLVEVLNPKTALFFIAFLPQFIDPAAGAVAPQFLLLGLIVTVTAIPCDAAVAWGGGAAGSFLARNMTLQRIQAWISGTILVGLGGYVGLGSLED